MKWFWKLLLWLGGILGGILLLAGVLLGCLTYEMRYKKEVRAQSVSPNGCHTLNLVAVGEAAWPFGPADGKLVLKENGKTIAEDTFTLFDDGGSIREENWEVTWEEDMVRVVIRGEEQYPEEFVVGFDGRVESRQIMD